MQVRGDYMQVRNNRRQVHSLTSEQGREVDARLRKICEIAESVFFQKKIMNINQTTSNDLSSQNISYLLFLCMAIVTCPLKYKNTLCVYGMKAQKVEQPVTSVQNNRSCYSASGFYSDVFISGKNITIYSHYRFSLTVSLLLPYHHRKRFQKPFRIQHADLETV